MASISGARKKSTCGREKMVVEFLSRDVSTLSVLVWFCKSIEGTPYADYVLFVVHETCKMRLLGISDHFPDHVSLLSECNKVSLPLELIPNFHGGHDILTQPWRELGMFYSFLPLRHVPVQNAEEQPVKFRQGIVWVTVAIDAVKRYITEVLKK